VFLQDAVGIHTVVGVWERWLQGRVSLKTHAPWGKKINGLLTPLQKRSACQTRSFDKKPLLLQRMTSKIQTMSRSRTFETLLAGSKAKLTLTVLLTMALTVWVDYISGYELSFFAFYFFPIGLAAWYGGRNFGLFFALVAFFAWFTSNLLSGQTFPTEFVKYWNCGNRLVAFIVVAVATARVGREFMELRSLLPICAWCKKIRDDAGYWEQVEDYFRKRDKAQFTHSICPDCSDRFRKPNTLLVERDVERADLLKTAFVKADLPHVLHCVESPPRAMEWLSGGGAYADRKKFPLPDVLIVDAGNQEEGCFRFLEWLRAQNTFKDLPVLILNAAEKPHEIKRAYDLGATSCFSGAAGYEELTDFLHNSRA
jgi:CheY-like chemotaxis protein